MAADVSSNLYDWSTTASSNQPDGTDSLTNLDDNLREIQSVLRGFLFHKGANIASAATPDPKITGLFHEITGTTTITGFATASPGMWKIFKFAANPLLKNSTAFALPTGADIQCATGDYMLAYSRTSTGIWDVAFVQPSVPRWKFGSFTRDMTAASSNQSVTGVGFKPRAVTFFAGIASSSASSWGHDDGTSHFAAADIHNSVANQMSVSDTFSILLSTGSGANQQGYITTMDTDGFTFAWTKNGSPTGTGTVYYRAEA